MSGSTKQDLLPCPNLSYPQPDNATILEYIHLDYKRLDVCTFTKVVYGDVTSTNDCPFVFEHDKDTFDTTLPEIDLMMSPVKIYKDPFRKGNHKIVLCQVLYPDGSPTPINTRFRCERVMDTVKDHDPWFGFEQEYFITDNNGIPLGWNKDGTFEDQGSEYHSYLSVGRHSGFERNLAEAHLMACLYAGLKMYGLNREGYAAMWEYQIGPCSGTDASDQLIVSRYILSRVAEQYGVKVAMVEPDVVRKSKVHNALHTNFSTNATRCKGGLAKTREMTEKLRRKPQDQLLKHYDRNSGIDAASKMIGEQFNPCLHEVIVTEGEKERSSIRIPSNVVLAGKGYFEERRVAADADPYEVSRVIAETVPKHMVMNKMIELLNPSLHDAIVTDGEKDMSSIRIPTNVVLAGKGYLDERRVAADADPYEVSRVIAEIVILDK